METPPPAEPASSSPVSWQTLYWTIVPLALLTITQPSGRVCGIHPKYRVYIRASPFICAADCLSTLIELLATPIVLRISPFAALKRVVAIRFRDEENLDSIRKEWFLRWFSFGFGCVGPLVKLAVMGNVPWTKAYGMMHLASFILVELMLLVKVQPPSISTPVPTGPTSPTMFGTILDRIELALLTAAMTLHQWVLGRAIIELAASPGIVERDRYAFYLFWFLRKLWFLGITLLVLLLVRIYSAIITVLRNRSSPALRSMWYLWGALHTVGQVVLGAWMMLIVLFPNKDRNSVWSFRTTDLGESRILLSCTFIFSSIFWLKYSLDYFPTPRKILRLEGDHNGTSGLDSMGYWLLIVFVTNVVVFTLWYARCYSSAGTNNPSWTAVFG